MDRYHLNPESFQASFVDKIVARFLLGEVGILPTETVYGLMCALDFRDARERIYEIKKRDHRKKLQVMIASLDDARLLQIEVSPKIRSLATQFWPGPLTIVLQDNSRNEIGVRIPKYNFLLAILKKIKMPLAATSANISGGDPLDSMLNNFDDLAARPDFVVKAEAHRVGSPSTVVRVNAGKLELIRKGCISMQAIQKALKRNA